MKKRTGFLIGLGVGAAVGSAYAYAQYRKMKSYPEVEKQTVLITGASKGLGKAFAQVFASNGFDLVLVARSLEKMEEIAVDLSQRYGVGVTCIDEDLSDPEGGVRVYERVKEKGIQVDQLVNNAGAGKMNRVVDADTKSIQELIALNCTSVTILCRLFGADMDERGYGRILNVSSLGALAPDPYFNVYGPSKAFEYRLTEAMYGEMEGSNVTVTALLSGPIQTNWANNAGKADSKMAADPMVIAQEGYEAMQRGQMVVVTTPLYKVGAVLSYILPDALIAKLICKWQSKLIASKH